MTEYFLKKHEELHRISDRVREDRKRKLTFEIRTLVDRERGRIAISTLRTELRARWRNLGNLSDFESRVESFGFKIERVWRKNSIARSYVVYEKCGNCGRISGDLWKVEPKEIVDGESADQRWCLGCRTFWPCWIKERD